MCVYMNACLRMYGQKHAGTTPEGVGSLSVQLEGKPLTTESRSLGSLSSVVSWCFLRRASLHDVYTEHPDLISTSASVQIHTEDRLKTTGKYKVLQLVGDGRGLPAGEGSTGRVHPPHCSVTHLTLRRDTFGDFVPSVRGSFWVLL